MMIMFLYCPVGFLVFSFCPQASYSHFMAWIAWIALNFKCIGHVCLQGGKEETDITNFLLKG